MEKQHLDEIRSRCEAATPGPWSFKDGGFIETHQHVPIGKVNRAITSVPGHRTVQGGFGSEMPNSRFIANARTDIPNLLDYVNELKSHRIDTECKTCIVLAELDMTAAQYAELLSDRDRLKAELADWKPVALTLEANCDKLQATVTELERLHEQAVNTIARTDEWKDVEIRYLQADRDKWKHRAEALERAIKTKSTACRTCTKKPPQREVESDPEYCEELYDCIGEDPSYPRWQFDLDRFAGKE